VIQNARGGGTRTSTAVTIDIPATAENAALLRSIVLYQHHNSWNFHRGDERLRRLLIRLDSWAPSVVDAVRSGRPPDSEWDLISSATELLLFTARVLDLLGAHAQTNAELTNAALSETPASIPRRNTAWDRLVDACANENRRKVRDALLSRIGARQGAGRTTYAIDVTAIGPSLSAFKKTWVLTAPPEEAPLEFRRLFNDIQSRIDEAVRDELEHLRTWYAQMSELLDPNGTTADVADPVAQAVAGALEAGIFEPHRLRTEFDDTARIFRRTRYSVIREIGEIVANSSSQPIGKLLSDLAADRGRPVAEIERFVALAQQCLTASNQRGLQQIETLTAGGGGESDFKNLRQALDDLETVLAEATRDH
jgi:hypothetical protein